MLRKFEEQPEWLKGGKLRDYQLDGLNFMVNRHVRYFSFRAHIKYNVLFPLSMHALHYAVGKMIQMSFLPMKWG